MPVSAEAAVKPVYLDYDTKDDRTEIYRLLARLHPLRRVRFLQGVCDRAVLPGSQVRPRVRRETWELAELARRDDSADQRLRLEVFIDLWNVAAHYRLDIHGVFRRLVDAVKRGAPSPLKR